MEQILFLLNLNKKMKRLITPLFILLNHFVQAQEEELRVTKDSIQKLDEVIIKANTILGNKFVAQNRTGFVLALQLA